MTQYTYTPSIDYINNLKFDYAETYSFQRGEKYQESIRTEQIEYEILRVRKEKYNDLTALENERFEELHGLWRITQYLINTKGQFHPSSIKTNTFQSTDPQIDRLKTIFKTEIKDIPGKLCAPAYRDAIVFYDSQNNIVSSLNICLSCQYMETAMFNHIQADWETYDLLKRFFIDIGHDVEDPTRFDFEDILKLKARLGNKD